MTPAARDRLERFLESNGLAHDDDVIERFAAYLHLLVRGSRAMNLIGKLDEMGIVEQLFCDSLLLAAVGGPLASPVIDVGSGAGFPGIPLKLLYPELRVVLVEPREKRHRFLGHVIRSLALVGVERVRARIEDTDLAPAGFACSKAFAPLPEWLDVAAGLVSAEGRVGVLVSASDWDRGLEDGALPDGFRVAALRRYQWSDGPLRVAAVLRRGG